ncbi:hypothetical protein A2U01_0039399, partial [Trifolium medium]|nr:hypothetical protein [Trifolium medium]
MAEEGSGSMSEKKEKE